MSGRCVVHPRHADVLVSDAWIDGFELLQESSDGNAVGRRGSIEQEGLWDLRHGWLLCCGVPCMVLYASRIACSARWRNRGLEFWR